MRELDQEFPHKKVPIDGFYDFDNFCCEDCAGHYPYVPRDQPFGYFPNHFLLVLQLLYLFAEYPGTAPFSTAVAIEKIESGDVGGETKVTEKAKK
jgi:hypothetical protein